MLLKKAPGNCKGPGFARVGADYLIHDARLETVDNTLDAPASSPAAVGQSCPAVARTF
eukprot:gene1573-11547_t